MDWEKSVVFSVIGLFCVQKTYTPFVLIIDQRSAFRFRMRYYFDVGEIGDIAYCWSAATTCSGSSKLVLEDNRTDLTGLSQLSAFAAQT